MVTVALGREVKENVKQKTFIAVAIAVTVVMPLSAANAQRARGTRGMRSAGVESLLRMRERLELSDGQIAQLEEVRGTALEQRKARAVELLDLQSRWRAGELDRDEWRGLMAERREASREQSVQEREQISGILTDEQRERAASLRSQRAGPRRGARAGRFRNGPRPGAVRGFRGRAPSRRLVGPRGEARFFRGRLRAIPDWRFRRGPIR